MVRAAGGNALFVNASSHPELTGHLLKIAYGCSAQIYTKWLKKNELTPAVATYYNGNMNIVHRDIIRYGYAWIINADIHGDWQQLIVVFHPWLNHTGSVQLSTFFSIGYVSLFLPCNGIGVVKGDCHCAGIYCAGVIPRAPHPIVDKHNIPCNKAGCV